MSDDRDEFEAALTDLWRFMHRLGDTTLAGDLQDLIARLRGVGCGIPESDVREMLATAYIRGHENRVLWGRRKARKAYHRADDLIAAYHARGEET